MNAKSLLLCGAVLACVLAAGISAYANARAERQREAAAQETATAPDPQPDPYAGEPSLRGFLCCAGFMGVVVVLFASVLIVDRIP